MYSTLSLDGIQKQASNQRIYVRGKALAQDGFVDSLAFDPAGKILLAYVQDPVTASREMVQVAFSDRGRPQRISCTCPESSQMAACCAHMVAALTAVLWVDLDDLPGLPSRATGDGTGRAEATASSGTAAPQAVDAAEAADGADGAMERLASTDEQPASAELSAVRPGGVSVTEYRPGGDTRYYPDQEAQQLRESAAVYRRLRAAALRQPGDDQRREPELSLRARLLLPRLTAEYATLRLQIVVLFSDRTYVVRKPEAFLQHIVSGEPYDFGRYLCFHPDQQTFDPVSERFLSWLLEIYYRGYQRQRDVCLATNPSFVQDGIELNPSRLWDFFQTFGDNLEALDFRISRRKDDPPRPARLHNSRPPLKLDWLRLDFPGAPERSAYELRLSDEASGAFVEAYSPEVRLKPEAENALRLLTRDAGLLLYQNDLYRPQGEGAPLYCSLIRNIALSRDSRLRIPHKLAADYLNLLQNGLGKQGGLGDLICPDAESQERIRRSWLEILVWLEPYGKGLHLKLLFRYGDVLINPHPSSASLLFHRRKNSLGHDKSELSQELELLSEAEQPLLIRDREREESCLKVLKRFSFSPTLPLSSRRQRGGSSEICPGYYLMQEDALYSFLSEGLPLLRGHTDIIYTSRELRKLQIRPLPPFKGEISLNAGTDLLELKLKDWPYAASDVRRILDAYREKRRYARLSDGAFLDLSGGSDPAQLQTLEDLNDWSGGSWEAEGLSLPKYRAHSLMQALDKLTPNQDLTIDSGLAKLFSALRAPDQLHFPLPPSVANTLRSYQKEGYHWLRSLDYYGIGGILADDMGLGKTLQALSVIAAIRAEEKQKGMALPCLVAAPTSLIYNWEAEARRFLPELRCHILEGGRQQREARLQNLEDLDLLICSYNVLRQDCKKLSEHRFRLFLLDEAQSIKNPSAQVSRAAKRIPSVRRLALTGTPIENRLSELWSIFDFLMPGYLYSHRRFQSEIEQPIIRDHDEATAEKLREMLRPFILRRMKRDVLKELPRKIDTLLSCDMSTEQAKLYAANLSLARNRIKELREEGEKTPGDELRRGQERIQLLALLTRLRQICCHPSLYLSNYNGGSGKMDSLRGLLETLLESGHRCLVFSQFTTMLDLIRQDLDAKNIGYFYLDGQVSAKDRIERVNRFNDGENALFLISLRAGGSGLNLTGADTVIHVDAWWNPAVEDQATDRAHRIGQKKVVQIFRLICRNTIEEKIYALQERKRALIDSVIESGGNRLNSMDLDEIRDLFR